MMEEGNHHDTGNTMGTPETQTQSQTQSVRVKTSVYWDIENCQVPKGLNAHGIAQNIFSALVKMNYCGPVSISAYGDTNRIPNHIQHALNSTGIALNHVPAGVKDASDKKILVDMLFWAVDNPAPANFMLISGDRDFSNALHQLRMRHYNILLAQPQQASTLLTRAATTVWTWSSLASGGSPLTQAEITELVTNVGPAAPSSLTSASDITTTNKETLDSTKSDTRRNYDNKSKIKYVPKSSNLPPNNHCHQQENTQVKRSEPNALPATSNPQSPYPPSSEPNPLPATSNPQNQVPYLPRTPSFPPVQQPYHNPMAMSNPQSQYPASSEPNSLPATGNPQNQYPYLPRTPPFPPVQQPYHNAMAMSNPQNQYPYYPPRTLPFPVQQPYHNPYASWNNGSSFPNHPNGVRPAYVFRPYQPENMHPRNLTSNGFCPMQPRSEGPPRDPTPSLTTLPDISNLSVSQSSSQSQVRPSYRQEFRPKMESSQNTCTSNGPPNKCYVPKTGSSQVSHSNSTSSTSSSTSLPEVVTESSASNNGTLGTQDCPPPSEYVQALIGVILHALNILRTEKLTPTESNISNCIQYGDPKHRGTDVKKALDSAMEQDMITVKNVGKLKLYIGKNEALWNCVNPLGTNQYPKATWNRIHQFLTSSSGQALILKTQCSYEAAQVLKKECLKELTLGDILKILNIISSTKKWIICHHTGWQPITITLAVAETKDESSIKTVWQPVTNTLAVTETNDVSGNKTVWQPISNTLAVAETNDDTQVSKPLPDSSI